MSEKAEAILAGIGGKGNVKDIEACITRIRVEVADPAQVDEAALREAGAFGVVLQGAFGVVRSGTVVQVVVGPEADQLSETLESLRK